MTQMERMKAWVDRIDGKGTCTLADNTHTMHGEAPRSHAGTDVKRKKRCPLCDTILVQLYRQRGRYNSKTGHRWEKVALYCEECKALRD